MGKSSFSSLNILFAFLAAAIGYLAFPTALLPLAGFISELFINFLKLLSLPVIFLSIFTTLANIKNLSQAKKLLVKVLTYTLLTTLIAATIGLILFLVIHPYSENPQELITNNDPKNLMTTYVNFIKAIVPENVAEAFLKNNVLGVVFIASILGLATLSIPSKEKESIQTFFNGLFQALLKISSIVIKLLPIGIFAFSVELFSEISRSQDKLNNLLGYAACVILANLIQGFVVLPLFLKLKGFKPVKTFQAMLPALTTAFFTKSSSASLPISMKCTKENLGVRESTASFTLPLCSVINMNGCAAFILITTLFVVNSTGAVLTIWQMLPWIFISTFMAIGNAGVPMGCYFLTSALLVGLNTPLTLLGMILPLYALFDMVETALNVWSDCCITAVVDKEVKTQEEVTSLSTN